MPSPSLLQQLASAQLASRIWQRDPAAFVGTNAGSSIATAILNRLGWLDAPASMEAELPAVEGFIAQLQQEELSDVYLLGMGGSSLCAEVLRDVLGSTNIRGRLTVLDTTDERAVCDVSEALVAEHACFLVASKSGSTIEVSSLERHFWHTYKDQGVEIVAIDSHDNTVEGGMEGVQDYMGRFGSTHPVGLESPDTPTYAELVKQYKGANPFPVDVVVGKDGLIKYITREYDPDGLEAAIEAALAEE